MGCRGRDLDTGVSFYISSNFVSAVSSFHAIVLIDQDGLVVARQVSLCHLPHLFVFQNSTVAKKRDKDEDK